MLLSARRVWMTVLILSLFVTLTASEVRAEIAVKIENSSLNGQTGTTITVGPGRMIQGTVRLNTQSTRVFREHTGIYYATWSEGYLYFLRDARGAVGSIDVSLNLQAPSVAGTYYIVFFFDAANPQGTWSNASAMDPRRHFELGRAVKVIVEPGAGGGLVEDEVANGINGAERISSGSASSGALDFAGNREDWFRIEARDAGVLSLSLRVKDRKELGMTVYNEDKTIASEDSDRRDFSLRVDAVKGRVYYVRVFAVSSGDKSGYELRSDFSAFETIGQNDRLAGSLDFNTNREDTYRLEALKEGRQTVELKIVEQGADIDLYVYDEAGKVKAESRAERGDELLNFDAMKGKNYYVRIRASNLWAVSDYSLITSLETAGAGGTLPAGIGSSLPLRAGDRKTGRIDGSSTKNTSAWYSYEAPENGTLTLDLDQIQEGMDLDLELYDQTGRRIAESDLSSGTKETITAYVNSGQKYYAKVTAYSKSDKSNYRLTASLAEEVSSKITDGGKIEGGNSRAQAVEIQLNKTHKDSVDYSGDVNDWYFVRADRDGPVTIRVELALRTARLNFALYSSTGAQLAVVSTYNDVMELSTEAKRGDKIYVWVWAAGWDQSSDFTVTARPGASGSSSAGNSAAFEIGKTKATQIQIGPTEYREQVSKGSDEEDWWFITPNLAGNLLIWVRNESGNEEIELEVYDENGMVIGRSNGMRTGNRSVVIPNAVKGRKYYLRLLLKSGDSQRYVMETIRFE